MVTKLKSNRVHYKNYITRQKTRSLLIVLCFAIATFVMCFSHSVSIAQAVIYDSEYDISLSNVSITQTGSYRIYQSSTDATSNTIIITADCEIYLDGVNIMGTDKNAMKIVGSTVTLKLASNTVNKFWQENEKIKCADNLELSSGYTGLAAINVDKESTLTITSDDRVNSFLSATGAMGYSVSDSQSHGGGGAGIGGDGGKNTDDDGETSGAINIINAYVEATGGKGSTYHGVGGNGIGGGGTAYGGTGSGSGNIKISNSIVRAVGGAAEKGRGWGSSGNAIGQGNHASAGACEEIVIENSTVIAESWNKNVTVVDNSRQSYGLKANSIIIDRSSNINAFDLYDPRYEYSDPPLPIITHNNSISGQVRSSKGKPLVLVIVSHESIMKKSNITGLIIDNVSMDNYYSLEIGKASIYLPIPIPTISINQQVMNIRQVSDNIFEANFDGDYLPDPEPLSYNLSFDSGDALINLPVIQNIYVIPAVLPALKRDGFTFAGWFFDVEGLDNVNGGDELSRNTTIYAKWSKIHSHELSEWLVVYMGTSVQRDRECLVCGLKFTEKLEVSAQVADSLNEVTKNPTTDTLKSAKEILITQVKESVRACDGKLSQTLIGDASGRIDEFELSENVADKLFNVYANALAGVRQERAKQKILLAMANEFNTANTSGLYTKDSLNSLKLTFENITTDIGLAEFEQELMALEFEWSQAKNSLKRSNLICEEGSIFREEGFGSDFSLSVLSNTSVDNAINKNKFLGIYIVKLMIEDKQVNEIEGKFTIRIKLDGDLSKVWKLHVTEWSLDGASSRTLEAHIKDGYAVFVTDKLLIYEINYSEPFPIWPLYILAGIVGLLVVLSIVLSYHDKRKRQGGDKQ